MNLSFDTGSNNKKRKCPDCGSKYVDMRRFILNDGVAYAVALIEAHRHNDEPSVYITCILGSWDQEGEEAGDHVTFSCRYGAIPDQEELACTAIDVPKTYDGPLAGMKLAREEALAYPRIDEFWEVVDFLLLQDLEIHNFLAHPDKRRFWPFSSN